LTTQRRVYRVSDPSVDQINQVLAQIADRLDQMEGFRGEPEFQSDVNLGGNKGINASPGVAADDLLTKSQTPSIPTGTGFRHITSGAEDIAARTVHEVPSGGTINQVLAKSSAADYALQWLNNSSGTLLSALTDVTITGPTTNDFLVFTGTVWEDKPLSGYIDLSSLYPVGSYKLSSDNVNPGTYLAGTTWMSSATGDLLIGATTVTAYLWLRTA
jgi:hypothetical protein